MAKLVYPKLSYKIVGALFKVHSRLSGSYQEKYYQRAVALELKENGLSYEKEIAVDLSYKGDRIGKYFLDFLIEDKIVLELKAKPRLSNEDFRQVMAYIRAKKIKLGILANFRNKELVYKRILNSKVKEKK